MCRKAAGGLAAADGGALEVQPRMGPESRSSPGFESPLLAAHLDCGDPAETRPSFHVSSFCRQEEPIHVSSHFISKDQKVSFVRIQITQLPKWVYFAEVTVKNKLF